MSGAEWVARALSFWAFEYGFVLTALGASVVVGLVCGVLGVFLVLQRLSLLGDTVGHATLPGLALAFLLWSGGGGVGLLVGALGTALLGAFGVGWLSGRARTRPDAALAIVLAVFFGAGLVVLSVVQREATASQSVVMGFLLGNAAAVTRAQLWVLLGCGAGLLVLVGVMWRGLVLAAFDPVMAELSGVRARWMRVGLVVALSVVVVLSVRVVGAVLVAAMLIIPASTVLLWSRRMGPAVVWSGVAGGLAGVLGAWTSFVLPGVATGPAMVIWSAAMFVGALGVRQVVDVVGRRRARGEGGGRGALVALGGGDA